jgi:hypothetical protein
MPLLINLEQYNGLGSLYANAGKWIDAEASFTTRFSIGSGISNKFTYNVQGSNYTLTIDSGDIGEISGIVAGDTITITWTQLNAGTPFQAQSEVKTVLYISNNVIFLDSPLQYNGPMGPQNYADGYKWPTDNITSGMLIVADKSPESIDFTFNLTPNGTTALDSVLDGQLNRFTLDNVDTLALATPTPMIQLGDKSGGLIKDVQLEYLSNDGAGWRSYKVTYSFLQWGLLQDGLAIPSYYDGANHLAPVVNFRSYSLTGNPNGSQAASSQNTEGNTGYFDENYNGGPSNYSLDAISWLDHLGDPIERLDYSNECTFTAIVNASNQSAPSSIYRIGLAFLPIDAAIYQDLPTNAGQNLLINAPDIDIQDTGAADPTIRTGYTNSAGARFDLKDLRVDIISGTQIRITGKVIPENSANETINYFNQFPDSERRMIMWAQVSNFNLTGTASDEVNVIVFDDDNYDAPTKGVQIPDVVSQLLTDIDGNDITSTSFPNTTTEDAVLYTSEFLLPEGVEYEGVRARVYAYNTVSGDAFTLEDLFINFDNVPFVNGRHEVNYTTPRNFLLPPTSDRNAIALTRKPSIDIVGKYGLELNYGYLTRWEYWLAQPNANAAAFFNLSEPNDGLNKDWQHYNMGDWIIRLSYYTRLDGVDDFNDQDILIRPYEDDPDIIFNKSFLVLSDNTTPSVLISDELIQITAKFTWLGGAFSEEWAEITVENFEGARVGYIDSVNDHGGASNNALKPIAGATKLDKTIGPSNVLTVKCLIDTSLIDVNSVSLSYRVFSEPRDGECIGMKYENFECILLENFEPLIIE